MTAFCSGFEVCKSHHGAGTAPPHSTLDKGSLDAVSLEIRDLVVQADKSLIRELA
jgi:hypothetical protein